MPSYISRKGLAVTGPEIFADHSSRAEDLLELLDAELRGKTDDRQRRDVPDTALVIQKMASERAGRGTKAAVKILARLTAEEAAAEQMSGEVVLKPIIDVTHEAWSEYGQPLTETVGLGFFLRAEPRPTLRMNRQHSNRVEQTEFGVGRLLPADTPRPVEQSRVLIPGSTALSGILTIDDLQPGRDQDRVIEVANAMDFGMHLTEQMAFGATYEQAKHAAAEAFQPHYLRAA